MSWLISRCCINFLLSVKCSCGQGASLNKPALRPCFCEILRSKWCHRTESPYCMYHLFPVLHAAKNHESIWSLLVHATAVKFAEVRPWYLCRNQLNISCLVWSFAWYTDCGAEEICGLTCRARICGLGLDRGYDWHCWPVLHCLIESSPHRW